MGKENAVVRKDFVSFQNGFFACKAAEAQTLNSTSCV